MTPAADVPKPRPSLWAVAALAALVALGLGTAAAAGARGGDFVHLWLGGHAWITEGAAALYAPEVHRELLAQAHSGELPPELWAGRNDRFGAFFYPPPAALAYAPLGMLPVVIAGTVHAVLSFLAVLVGGVMAGRWLGVGSVPALLVVLTTPAFFHNHVLGQNGGWVFALLALAGLGLGRRRDLWAGLALGVLVCKPSWLLAVAWVPLCMGRWRTVAGMAGSSVGISLGSMLFLGVEPWRKWLAMAADLAALSRAGDYPLDLQYSLWGLGRRVMGLGTGGDLLGGALCLIVAAVTVQVVGNPRVGLARKLALGFCAAALVNPHLHPYDITGGVFAVLALWRIPEGRQFAGGVLLIHHGGQVMEGLSGTGWAVPPATVGLFVAWAALWVRGCRTPSPSTAV